MMIMWNVDSTYTHFKSQVNIFFNVFNVVSNIGGGTVVGIASLPLKFI